MAKKRLGDLLVEKKLVTEKQVEEALRIQTSGNRRLGSLLIKMKVLNEDQLIDALVSQDDVHIINLTGDISPEVKKIFPRYLCLKYSALPLQLSSNNVLKVAMVDPSDDEAIQAIEDYTGTAVDPGLNKEKDIIEGIKKNIPLSIKDIFNPQTLSGFAKMASVIAFFAVITISLFAYRYFQTEKYGTISQVAESTIYKNHDIMINVNSKTGLITLLGHGAYSDGHYSVSFKSAKALVAFIDKKKKDFSQNQYEWINWLQQEKLSRSKG